LLYDNYQFLNFKHPHSNKFSLPHLKINLLTFSNNKCQRIYFTKAETLTGVEK